MAEMDAFERRVAETLLRYADELSPSVDAMAVATGVAAERPRRRPGAPSWRPATLSRRSWALVLVAALSVAIIGAMLITGSRPTIMPPIEPATPAPSRSLAPMATIPPVGAWSPILSETHAGTPPPAATCPPGANPDVPGPADQERPDPRHVGDIAAAFDRHSGRIVYVDSLGGVWTFDVCANTWHRMDPKVSRIVPQPDGTYWDSPYPLPPEPPRWLVYDVDSDRTVAFGWEGLSVYDANSNTWTHREPVPDAPSPTDFSALVGAAYDPVSGLILATVSVVNDERSDENRTELWAYDVDASRWARVGVLPEAVWLRGFLFGHAPLLDRLILGGYNWDDQLPSVLVDPRTGVTTILNERAASPVGGFGSAVYGRDADTAYVYEAGERDPDFLRDRICRFDPVTIAWDSCWETGFPKYLAFGAIVGDPINQRLLLIHGTYGEWWSEGDDGIWALDPANGTKLSLLAPSG